MLEDRDYDYDCDEAVDVDSSYWLLTTDYWLLTADFDVDVGWSLIKQRAK